MTPTTKTEMIRAIAKALVEGDYETLLECQNTNNDWLQSDDEREAMDELIQAAIVTLQIA